MAACISGLHQSQDIVTVKERYEKKILGLSGVVGIGIGNCNQNQCIKVFVDQKNLKLKRQIPKKLEGFKVDVEVVESIQLQPKNVP